MKWTRKKSHSSIIAAVKIIEIHPPTVKKIPRHFQKGHKKAAAIFPNP